MIIVFLIHLNLETAVPFICGHFTQVIFEVASVFAVYVGD